MPGCKVGDTAIIIGPVDISHKIKHFEKNIGRIVRIVKDVSIGVQFRYPEWEKETYFEIELIGEGTILVYNTLQRNFIEGTKAVIFTDNWLHPLRGNINTKDKYIIKHSLKK